MSNLAMRLFAWRSPFWPSLCAFLISLGFVMFAPGDIRKDAYEYDTIARSIVAGQGFSFEGEFTMLREPGYPVFRAIVYWLGGQEQTILLVQALLAGWSIYFLARSFQALGGESWLFSAWSTLTAYSFFTFAGRHLSEILVGFLCSFLVYLTAHGRETKGHLWSIPVVASALCLTRFSFLFFALGAIVLSFFFFSPLQGRRRFIHLGLALSIFFTLLLPWSVRNHVRFGEWSITSRTGIQMYARVWKARQPWTDLIGTYVSVLGGRVFAEKIGFSPIVDHQWRATANRFFELRELYPRDKVDAVLREEAIATVVSSNHLFLRLVAWSPLELLRFFAFPSPFSRDFPIEGMFYPLFYDHNLSTSRVILLVMAQLIQLLWFFGIIISQVLGFLRYRLRWLPGLLVLATALAYIPFDAIIRYAFPIHPWIIASMAFLAWDWMAPRIHQR